jgi:hypothetical protein
MAAGRFFGGVQEGKCSLSVGGAWLCGSVPWTSCGVLDGGDGHSYLSLATSSIL